MMQAGLLAACLGAVLLALSSHLGVVTGFVGTAVWATPMWRLVNGLGWLLLIGGFVLQYLHVRRTPRSAQPATKVDALLTLLERKGILTQGDVREELAQMRKRP